MNFTPERAEIRFGCGLAPGLPMVQSVDDMLALLQGPDKAAEQFAIPGMATILEAVAAQAQLRKLHRAAADEDAKAEAVNNLRKVRRGLQKKAGEWLGQSLLRRALTQDGFRERLVSFWTDHFTAVGKSGGFNRAQVNYAEDAIRPHISGRFGDMLRAVVTNPLMLHYLDQVNSTGPNSHIGKSRKNRGLNENLARELLELHTLGVDGSYSQQDVRQLAELLTGLTFNRKTGFYFRKALSEPGVKTVLSVKYEGTQSLDEVFAALDDLAEHPSTARHIAQKLAVHFVGDQPDPNLIEALEKRYLETGGTLLEVYEVLLNHPAAWVPGPGNVKQPMDFVGSSLRALDITAMHMPGKKLKRMRELFIGPMIFMGQTWGRPEGPDGWPEADNEWITPQRLAARLQWSMTAPFQLRRILPDPRQFVDMALGSTAPEAVRFAAKAADTRASGVGIVLASPAFQRM